jgi:FKBP-type peptidyl-prolyl cis-trans isomerase FklB
VSSLRRLALGFAVLLLLLACRTPAPDPRPKLETPDERFSYGLGARLGNDLRQSGHSIDRELVLRGVEDGLDGESALSEPEVAAALKEGVELRYERDSALRAERALAFEREGREFLERNRGKPGVVELPSGLQYEVLAAGSGPPPGVEDWVTCHYRGTLLDGTVFDETASRGSPRTFAVTSVIDGFEEALLRMPAGARWRLYVPPALAYGEHGAGRKIPPNSTLLFDVELIAIGGGPTASD